MCTEKVNVKVNVESHRLNFESTSKNKNCADARAKKVRYKFSLCHVLPSRACYYLRASSAARITFGLFSIAVSNTFN